MRKKLEVLNDVLGYSDRKIYQDTKYFKFSLDGVLLANFVKLKQSAQHIIDVGTGTGIIPLLLTLKTEKQIDAIEIEENLVKLFTKTIHYNKLDEQIHLIFDDIKNYSKNIKKLNYYDVVISNPPYFSKCTHIHEKSNARHENYLTLEELIKSSRRLLKNKGSFYLVYNSDSLSKVIELLIINNFSIKTVQFVHHNIYKKASFFMLEAIKNGNTTTNILNPFILYDQNNNMTEEYRKVYNGEVIGNESKEL